MKALITGATSGIGKAMKAEGVLPDNFLNSLMKWGGS